MEVPSDWMQRRYDVLVIGGGINGAAIARDAAHRGLSVLIVEARDWGWATSAKSSRLAHGGLRYLEMFEFGLVHEALQDRERLLRQAPHLVRPLRFLYPLYPEVVARRTVRVGLWVYDLLSHGKSVPGRSFLTKGEALEACPALAKEGLAGAAVYYDASIQSVERLVLENIQDACAHGAVALRDAPVRRLVVEDSRCTGAVVAVDKEEHLVRADAVVNAAGTWVDEVLGALGEEAPPKIRKTKGIHVAVPRFLDDGLLVRAEDGRTFFVLPWGDTCYIGTTDTDYHGDAGDAMADADDVSYLLRSARQFLPDAPLDDILYTWAGVRALVNQAGVTESNVTRRHILHDHAKEGAVGLWTLQGGKITTARSLAEEAVDEIARAIGKPSLARQHPTREALLPGGVGQDWEGYLEDAVAVAASIVPPAAARHLVGSYGGRWREVAECDEHPDAHRAIAGSDHVFAEVTWAVRREQARELADVMLRRTQLGLARHGNPQAAAEVAKWMGRLLGWSFLERKRQMRRYRLELRVFAVPERMPGPATSPPSGQWEPAAATLPA